MSLPKLVTMANQIGRFFVSEDKATAVAAIADHLEKFWDPRMRAGIVAHLRAGGEGLDPAVREAVERLPPPAEKTRSA
ncbi:MAG: formate dehydrogenase subunit delta [Bauldia sp.]|nr:MAG: formate dehydrogenase subunit delta [Bauldia sp.]MBZ0227135.1 formate dehydrogenase subunit delta [Bauldia sp.]